VKPRSAPLAGYRWLLLDRHRRTAEPNTKHHPTTGPQAPKPHTAATAKSLARGGVLSRQRRLLARVHRSRAGLTMASLGQTGDGVSKGAVGSFGPAEGKGVSKGGMLCHPPFDHAITLVIA
ncbi:hypothetical protein EOZ79_22495, partial [Escherichia coli]|nr:hypothetical protein [Escherichia coli]